MIDTRIDRLGRVLTEYSLDVQPGQVIEIIGTTVAAPLVTSLYRHVLLRGGHPTTRIALPGLPELLFANASNQQLEFIPESERYGIEKVDGLIRILSDTNTRALSGVDPERQQRFQRARTDLRNTMLQRAASGELNWSLTLFPTEAYAQDAEMSLTDYEEFVYAAGFLDDEDPVAHWTTISAEQQRLVDWLADKREVRVLAPDTDLRLRVDSRTWINADGIYNFPDGEIFTGPVEESVEGHVRFTFPSIASGRSVEDIRLEFREGKVVRASAARNDEYLQRMLESDEGARYLGEFAFGTNRGIQRFTGNTLFDEKIGGTLHMAVGAGYPQSGSKNQSAVHWDMILDLRPGSEVFVDDVLFIKDGEFQV